MPFVFYLSIYLSIVKCLKWTLIYVIFSDYKNDTTKHKSYKSTLQVNKCTFQKILMDIKFILHKVLLIYYLSYKNCLSCGVPAWNRKLGIPHCLWSCSGHCWSMGLITSQGAVCWEPIVAAAKKYIYIYCPSLIPPYTWQNWVLTFLLILSSPIGKWYLVIIIPILLLIVGTNSFLVSSDWVFFIICGYVFSTHTYPLTIDLMALLPHLVSRMYFYFLFAFILFLGYLLYSFPLPKYCVLVSCLMTKVYNFPKYFKFLLCNQIFMLKSVNSVLKI